MLVRTTTLAIILSTATSLAMAQPLHTGTVVDKFHITDQERAACQTDAVLLCSHTYPDEDLLLSCMKTKRDQLTPTCLTAFVTGLKKRHIPF